VAVPPRRDDHATGETLGVRAPDLGDGALEVVEDRGDDQPGAPLRARGAELRGPPVVRTRAGEEVLGAAGDDGVEPGAERGTHRARHRVGAGEDDLGGDAVAIELTIARRGVPAPAEPDLVEAVAVVVLAEPLVLEVGVADEVALHRGRRAHLLDEPLALGELVVEVGAERRIEELAVLG
jgi:hypothetical protein